MKRRIDIMEHAGEGVRAMRQVERFVRESGLPPAIFELVKIRSSQINGCGFCLDMHMRQAKAAGETDERLWSVGAWRHTPFFSDAERAALALTEEATRLADRGETVPDSVWDEATRHFGEPELAGLIFAISHSNAWNRIMAITRTPPGGLRTATAS
ncbi:alkylhydroperoxidase AhpD family core domain-containing protein [Actinopolymorpha cephalotaxi]|uniref:AhpD family alkylhydroperoxidase n=1 Tax=Actinopolymorpha cephalotaxi TaxID=504797 RepID=A0A1I2XTA4_9ACTN|nr:carboxymuconolactone decarboxylase family protein [Actinopolymorpha cephalotaxi]NYH87143.1 AhpD family alkylhydroperoxidase [Actinopolymorpha cephalotaxi]SFH15956.1 alkylhydroperoxidase AhpD family core domain-containing protein [Actinopolymorpha cephalotaxi]